MNFTKNIARLVAGLTVAASLISPAISQAAGSASFALSPASTSVTAGAAFSVGVYVNGTAVNAVTANLVYDAASLTCNGVDGGSAFGGAISGTCGGGTVTISRYTIPGTPALDGSQLLASVNFTPTAQGTANVSVTSGQIASNGLDTWNGAGAIGSYTIAPAAGGRGAGAQPPVVQAARTNRVVAAVEPTPAPAPTPEPTVAPVAKVEAPKPTALPAVPASNKSNVGTIFSLVVLGFIVLASIIAILGRRRASKEDAEIAASAASVVAAKEVVSAKKNKTATAKATKVSTKSKTNKPAANKTK